MERPSWVRLGLWKVPTRGAAFVYVNVSLLLALIGVVLGVVVDPLGYFGAGFVFAALWYWKAIAWMDANNGWTGEGTP